MEIRESCSPGFGKTFAADFFLQLHQAFHESLGTRWAAGNIDIDRNNSVNALQNVVSMLPIWTSTVRTTSHGNYISGLGHLVKQRLDAFRHLQGDGAGNNHDIG